MLDTVTVLDKTFERFISAAEIDEAVQRVADRINEDYKDDDLILLVTLNGAIVFAVDLMKRLTVKCRLSCVKLSSYSGTETTRNVKTLIGLNDDLKGQRVLIVEDIVDTGTTYKHLCQILEPMGPKDIRIATMTCKPDKYKLDLPVHYIGLNIPNRFVVGRGLDYDGYGRNLPDLYQLKTDNNNAQ